MGIKDGLRGLLAYLLLGLPLAGCSADSALRVGTDQTFGSAVGPPAYASAADAVARLRLSGLEPISPPVLSGSSYMVDAVKRDGTQVRVLFAAHSGDIVRIDTVSLRRCGESAATNERTKSVDEPRPPCARSRRGVRLAGLAPARRTRVASLPTPAATDRHAPTRQTQPVAPALDLTTGSAPTKPTPLNVLLLASDQSSARTGYQQLTMQPAPAPASERRHALSATCIGVLDQDQRGFALVTNPPKAMSEFNNGDTLIITAPLCPALSEGADDSRMTMVMKKTGDFSSNIAKPKFQYLVFGEVLSPPRAAPAPERLESTFRDCEFCPEMVLLPGGSFAMGGNGGPSERPVHRVTVSAVALARTPVTVSQWRQCVLSLACSPEPVRDPGYSDAPVHGVSFDDAQQYVSWLSRVTKKIYRLPTEAEWEFAARAGSSSEYWWGDRMLDGMANCRPCGEPFRADMPVRATSFMPNPFGLYEMAGGVAQWVSDCWHESYDGAPTDGSSWEDANCSQHVLRGGSWRDELTHLRASSRDHFGRSQRDPSHGFRVARSP